MVVGWKRDRLLDLRGEMLRSISCSPSDMLSFIDPVLVIPSDPFPDPPFDPFLTSSLSLSLSLWYLWPRSSSSSERGTAEGGEEEEGSWEQRSMRGGGGGGRWRGGRSMKSGTEPSPSERLSLMSLQSHSVSSPPALRLVMVLSLAVVPQSLPEEDRRMRSGSTFFLGDVLVGPNDVDEKIGRKGDR